MITGRDPERLSHAATTLDAHAVRANQADLADLDHLTTQVAAHHTPLDVLIANAGISRSALLHEVTPEAFDEEVAINLRGTFFTVQRLAPLMADGGSIVLVSSCLDQRGSYGQSVYAATKAAIASLARSFAAELRDRQIRVNSVAPGPTDTPLFDKYDLDPATLTTMKATIATTIPLNRLATPADIANAITFLSSPQAAYINAEQLTIDAGWTRL
jgi:NAD(P)-dependent dehydrogenase (short-subunit alcohol dehydrogenase family)